MAHTTNYRAIFLPVSASALSYGWDEHPALAVLQDFVGGPIEVIYTPHLKGMTLIVNEEGRLHKLLPNPAASAFGGQILLGPALLLLFELE